MSEILDVVNENDKVIGKATREECHKNPNLIHRVVHCWIFNSKGQVLWQQRSKNKKQAPQKWDMSCGGHLNKGEKPLKGLLRELKEELGITSVNPVLAKKYIERLKNQTEMVYLYYAFVNKKAEEFKIEKNEIQQVKWFNYDKALNLYINKKVKATHFIATQVPAIYQTIIENSLNTTK